MAGIAGSRDLERCVPAGPFRFEAARREDDAEIRKLLRAQPLGGRVRLALTREPSVRGAAEVEGNRHHTVVARDDQGNVVGVGSRSVRQFWLGGEKVLVGYLGQLRRSDGGTRHMRLLARGFAELELSRRGDEASFDLTSIVADNASARRLLERGLPGFPRYRPVGDIMTLMLEVNRRRVGTKKIVRGTRERMAEVARFLAGELSRHPFAPVWTEDVLLSASRSRGLAPGDFLILEDGGRITGCCAVWDQRAFKQVLVHGYDDRLTRLRPWINLGRRMARRPTLPSPGRQLDLGYVSHFVVTGSRRSSIALVRAAMASARDKGLDHLVLGLPARDPLTGVLQKTFRAHTYASTLYVVHRPGDSSWNRALGGGLPRVEVATL